MEVTESRSSSVDNELRTRIRNNSRLCARFTDLLRNNGPIRMSSLANRLIMDLFDAKSGQPFNRKHFDELAKLVNDDSSTNMEHIAMVLTYKSLVHFAHSIARSSDLRATHGQEREKLFGCVECERWCKTMVGALAHAKKNSCPLSIRNWRRSEVGARRFGTMKLLVASTEETMPTVEAAAQVDDKQALCVTRLMIKTEGT